MTVIANGRQHGLFVVANAAVADIAAGVTFNLPPGAILTDGLINFTTALSGGTTPAVTVKDNLTSPTSIFGSVSANTAIAAGRGTSYPQGATFTVAATGAPTGGAVQVILQYIEGARTDEVYGA